MPKNKKGSGKVEYLACKQDLNLLLQQGYSLKSAHEKLTEDGKLKFLSYPMLLHYAREGVKIKQIASIIEETVSNTKNTKMQNTSNVEKQNNEVNSKSTKEKGNGPNIVIPNSMQRKKNKIHEVNDESDD